MKTFSHGGRFGDLFYALWTMRELGGGRLILTDYHKGNWSLDMAKTLKTFLVYQSFIEDVIIMPYADLDLSTVDFNLQEAEDDFNPEAFPECPEAAAQWPGSANIAKRYATHFGLNYHPGETWLEAPMETLQDIAMHFKDDRILRRYGDWIRLMLDAAYLCPVRNLNDFVFREIDWLHTATVINSAKLFLGVVSGPHALAEGLGKTRLVEQASDCFNVSVLPPSQCINGLSNDEVIERVRELL